MELHHPDIWHITKKQLRSILMLQFHVSVKLTNEIGSGLLKLKSSLSSLVLNGICVDALLGLTCLLPPWPFVDMLSTTCFIMDISCKYRTYMMHQEIKDLLIYVDIITRYCFVFVFFGFQSHRHLLGYQPASITISDKPSIDPSMLYPLFMSMIGFAGLVACLVILSSKVQIYIREKNKSWVKDHV